MKRGKSTNLVALLVLATSAISINPAHAAAKVTTTAIATSASPVTINSSVTLTATVSASGGSPSGSVNFSVNSNSIGSCTLSAGVCFITHSWSLRGEYPVVATYVPNGNFTASSSVPLTEIVTRLASSVSVVSSKPFAYIGNPLDFTITVTGSGPTPAGTVILYAYESNTVIGTCTLASASCVINLAASTVGNHRVWASYSGDDATYLPSNSSYIYQNNVAKLIPTIVFTDSPTVSNFGDLVTFTAALSGVDGVPVGSVLFEHDEGLLGSCTLSAGQCSLSLSSLAIGLHTITAEFGGDTTYSGKEAIITHQVNALAMLTTTSISSSSNPSIESRTVTFTISVSAATGTPTGDVTVKAGALTLGVCTLVAGSCTYATSAMPLGSTTLTAYYEGSTSYQGSNGSISQQVTAMGSRTTSASLTSIWESSTVGTPITLRSTVVNSEVVTGSVAISDGAEVIGSCTLNEGTCEISYSPATVGIHSFHMVFYGNALFDTSTASLNYQVNIYPSTLTFTSNHNPAPRLTLVTFSVVLQPAATGLVIFEDGETQVGSCSLSGGACSVALSFSTLGTHVISAEYGGDSHNAAITKVLTQVIGLTGTTVSLTSDSALAQYYSSITFTALVSDTSTTGTIEFNDGATGMASCEVVAGRCSISYYRLSVGSHNLTAVYSGDATHAGSTSPSFTQEVTLAATTITIVSSENPYPYGSALTFTGSVTSVGTGATGSIQFEDYTSTPSTIIGTCTIAATLCSITLNTPLSIGTHKIRAEYASDGNYAGSISAEIEQVITEGDPIVPVETKTATTATLSAVPISAVFLDRITFSTTVTSASGTPTGLIILEEEFAGGGEAVVGSCTLSAGSCTFSTFSLSVGSHEIYFEYSGSTTYAASLASSVFITITPRPVAAVIVNTKDSPTPTPALHIEKGKPLVATINEKDSTKVDFTVKDANGRVSSVEIVVPAGAVPAGATISVGSEASNKPDEKGFQALDIKIISTGATPIMKLDHPLILQISRQATLGSPAMSSDGENWYLLKRVTTTSLTGDELDGFFVGENKSLSVMTLHLSLLDILKQQSRLSVQTLLNHVHIGQSVQLSYRGGSGTGEVTFATSTPAVCRVSASGQLTALALGSCGVTVAKGHDAQYMNASSEVKICAIRPAE